MEAALHVPVLLKPVLDGLRPRDEGIYVDATSGAGGHAAAILEYSGPHGRLLAMDADERAVDRVQGRLLAYGDRVLTVHANFRRLRDVVRDVGWPAADGILFDLGFSTYQLEHERRGLSFQRDEPLDMRFNATSGGTTAFDLLIQLSEEEIARLLWNFGEEPASRRIARAIVARRQSRPVTTTGELRFLVHGVVSGRGGQRIDPATRTFQALRIAVNDELSALEEAMPQALALLAPGGRLAVISFHSLEDRVVKRFMAREIRSCLCPPGLPECRCGHTATLRPVTRSPIVATPQELALNHRARSAKLRIAEKLPV